MWRPTMQAILPQTIAHRLVRRPGTPAAALSEQVQAMLRAVPLA